jgi:hypothetical protein
MPFGHRGPPGPLTCILSICLAAAGCGGAAHQPTSSAAAKRAELARERQAAARAELARERRAASYSPPPAAVLAAAGPTPAARNGKARAELRRAARDLQLYRRAHGTYAIGPIQNLHHLDPGTALVDFVDGRESDFFLAVNPPTTTTIWRYNFDHDRAATVCGPGGYGCPPDRRW